MLSSLLHIVPVRPDEPESVEDIFSTGLGLFPDEVTVSHGDSDLAVIYRGSSALARRAGDLTFLLASVDGEEERTKFAHYLWNASVLLAEMIGGIPEPEESNPWEAGRWWVGDEVAARWKLEGQQVLELGAGAGLAGVVSVFAGAETVTISDYPSDALLKNVRVNVDKNVPASLRDRVSIEGHRWGDFMTPFAVNWRHGFDRILAGDCLWVRAAHHDLAASMAHFLSDSPSACVDVVAGFHTGRGIVAEFFEDGAQTALGRAGLVVEEIYELDVNGNRRDWDMEREEGITERKRWLVVAQLRRSGGEAAVEGSS